jgi:hypothetical protein
MGTFTEEVPRSSRTTRPQSSRHVDPQLTSAFILVCGTSLHITRQLTSCRLVAPSSRLTRVIPALLTDDAPASPALSDLFWAGFGSDLTRIRIRCGFGCCGVFRLESVQRCAANPSLEDMLDAEDALSEQLDSLPFLMRYQYDRSAQYLTTLMDPAIEYYQQVGWPGRDGCPRTIPPTTMLQRPWR